jgi:hypothetical protein
MIIQKTGLSYKVMRNSLLAKRLRLPLAKIDETYKQTQWIRVQRK